MEKGIASLGVLVLFSVLAVLLGVGLPIIKSDAPLKASDWLGFAGNIIAAVLAAVAATVAWVAAQRQIRHAARQNSVIAYGALREVLAAINSDIILNREVAVELEMIESDLRVKVPEGEVTPAEAELISRLVQERLRTIRDAEAALERDRANPWGGATERAERDDLIKVVGCYGALCHARIDIFLAMCSGNLDSDELVHTIKWGMLPQDNLEAALAATRRFDKMAKGEMAKIYALMDTHFESVTLLN
jgi:hypothetical protein